MKVTVTRKAHPSHNDLLKENERLFQENRDLERKIAASDSELKHANEVIMALTNQIEKMANENVNLLDKVDYQKHCIKNLESDLNRLLEENEQLERDYEELREDYQYTKDDRTYAYHLAESYRIKYVEAKKLQSFDNLSNLIDGIIKRNAANENSEDDLQGLS